ncbi:MAG: hypothetical protein LAO06_12600 [Acidobacteriia bacterium]|nr:hypothetical protein [Terriglobia bacterium]
MLSTNCQCGHEKRDHVFPLIGKQGYGTCRVCLCERYAKVQARDLAAAAKAGSQP